MSLNVAWLQRDKKLDDKTKLQREIMRIGGQQNGERR